MGRRYHLRVFISYHAWRVVQTKKSRLCHESEHAFDTFELDAFVGDLAHAKLKYFQTYELSVSADFCLQRTVLIDAVWQGREQTLEFLEEVRAEITHEFDDLDHYFMDMRPLNLSEDGLEVDVFLLPKIKVSAILKACQAQHLRLQAIYITDEIGRGLNLFPWRQRKIKSHKYRRALRLGLLPACVFLMSLGYVYYENILLERQQKSALRLQKQEAKYRESDSNSLRLGDALPVLGRLNAVEKIQIDAAGQINVSGFATKSADVSEKIQSIEEQTAIEKNSLHDLNVQEEKGQTFWQASFQLMRADS